MAYFQISTKSLKRALMKKKIVAAICKSGVWAACHFSVDKVCTGYYETFDVCDL